MNPNDVFPRRNLPDEAENWGRTVEDRVRNLEYAATIGKQDTGSLNRTTASSLQELTRQLDSLREVYDAIPKPVQRISQASNFGISSGWYTATTASIVVPSGAKTVQLTAIGSGHLVSTGTSGLMTTQSRLDLSGVSASPSISNGFYAGSGNFKAISVPSFSWELNVTPGQTLTVAYQIFSDAYTQWNSGSGSYVVLTLQALFIG